MWQTGVVHINLRLQMWRAAEACLLLLCQWVAGFARPFIS